MTSQKCRIRTKEFNGYITGRFAPLPEVGHYLIWDDITEKWYEFQNGIVEWFTGLKDNKRTEEFPDGQEIYEGDITEHKYYITHPNTKNLTYHVINQVKWGYMEFGFVLVREIRTGGLLSDWDGKNDTIEVIGNIHEHRHLLTKDNNKEK